MCIDRDVTTANFLLLPFDCSFFEARQGEQPIKASKIAIAFVGTFTRLLRYHVLRGNNDSI